MKRKTTEGEKHFTASVWIITKATPRKMLLVHHKKMGKWLQPGGHIESFENPVEAAVREIKEETGIDISFLKEGIEVVDDDGTFLPVPTFLIEQTIPARLGEPKHYHLDFQYVVSVAEQSVAHNLGESHNIGWFTKKEALKLPIHEDTRVVIKKLL